MSLRRSAQQKGKALGRALADLDPSKLMTAPILFVAFLALLDRAVYEAERAYGAEPSFRITRLSAVSPPEMIGLSTASPTFRT